MIDKPIWPAHNTLWSHLASDHSLDELHTFAERVGLSRRSFDGDHYDVPEARYAGLIAAGAEIVSIRQFVERLHDSGLRITQKQRRS